MKKFDVVSQKPFFPMFDVVSRFPGDEGGTTNSENEEEPATDKPVPDEGSN